MGDYSHRNLIINFIITVFLFYDNKKIDRKLEAKRVLPANMATANKKLGSRPH
jgi:hypothetical protein